MAVGYPEKMRDTNGAVNTYTAALNTVDHEPPKHPHPDAELVTNYNGRAIHPNEKGQRLEGFLEYLRENGGEFPVDGDKTARLRRMKCWDPLTNRGLKSYTGKEPCEEPTCPHPQPHVASQWFSDQFPRFRDIAHVLYPGGTIPTRVTDECTYCTPPTSARCRDPHGGMVCTRDTRHDGDHVACGGIHHELGQWPGTPAPPEPEQLDMLALLEEMTS